MTQPGTSKVYNSKGTRGRERDTATYPYLDPQPRHTHRFEYSVRVHIGPGIAKTGTRHRSRYRSGIVPITIQTLQFKVHFLRLRWKWQFCVIAVPCWKFPRNVRASLTWLSPRDSANETFMGGFVTTVLFHRCALREDSMKHAVLQSFKLVSSCHPYEVESLFLSLSHVLGLVCFGFLGSRLSS